MPSTLGGQYGSQTLAEPRSGLTFIDRCQIVVPNVLKDLGFGLPPPFYRDKQFALACLGGIGFWAYLLASDRTLPHGFLGTHLFALLSLVMWQPLMEEVVFRGYVQGTLVGWSSRRLTWVGLTVANWLTSVTFASAHLLTHSPSWVGGIFLVSLLLGYFRDRYASLYPSIALHCYYNAGYFLLIDP